MTNIVKASRGPQPLDEMDTGLDLLVTVQAALYAEQPIDQETLTAIRGTIERAIKLMQPARERLDQI